MSDAALFREIVPEVDNWFYRKPYAVEPDALSLIKPLKFDAAGLIWTEICGEVYATRFRCFPANHWVQHAVATGSNWYTQWNNPELPDLVTEFLTARLAWEPDTSVVVVMDNRYSYQLPWQVFLGNWKSFVFDEDGLIVIRQNQNLFVFFGDDGVFYIGKRPLLRAFDQ